ncbi:hypothetical protein WMF38_57665 [Sorangium sp. So ce118]
MSKWADALEHEARRLAVMRATAFTIAARCIRAAVALGVETRHEAALVLTAVGLGDDVERVLGPESALDDVLTEASQQVAEWPEWKRSDDVKRREAEFEKRLEDLGIDAACKVGGTYAEQLGAPKGCLCTWLTRPTFTGPALAERGAGMMPCPVHPGPRTLRVAREVDEASGEILYRREPMMSPRYVGEFGDIDEPSVGDVDGYGGAEVNRAEAHDRLEEYHRLIEASLKSKRFGAKETDDLEQAARMAEKARGFEPRQYSRLMRWTGYVQAMTVAAGAVSLREMMALNATIHQRHKTPSHPADDHGDVV